MFFGGVPLWHCSIAYYPRRSSAPLPVEDWSLVTRGRVERLTARWLKGVGIEDQEVVEQGQFGLHTRRRCTDEEAREIAARVPNAPIFCR